VIVEDDREAPGGEDRDGFVVAETAGDPSPLPAESAARTDRRERDCM